MHDYCFIIGAQRSGTTYLYNLLAQHPQVEMAKPVRPEPKFFLDQSNADKNLEYYVDTYFGHKSGAKVRGEKSTSYIESAVAAERIAQWFPRAKLICMLRDPVERAISNYRFSVANGLETLPMREAFMKEPERTLQNVHGTSVSPFAYLARSRYAEQLDVFRDRFPAGALHLIVSEKLFGSPDAARNVYEFLGIETNFQASSLSTPINESPRKIDPAAVPDDELLEWLREYFNEPVARLARDYAVDTSAWNF